MLRFDRRFFNLIGNKFSEARKNTLFLFRVKSAVMFQEKLQILIIIENVLKGGSRTVNNMTVPVIAIKIISRFV